MEGFIGGIGFRFGLSREHKAAGAKGSFEALIESL